MQNISQQLIDSLYYLFCLTTLSLNQSIQIQLLFLIPLKNQNRFLFPLKRSLKFFLEFDEITFQFVYLKFFWFHSLLHFSSYIR